MTIADSTDWAEVASSYLAEGHPRNAAQAAAKAINSDPTNPTAWVARAAALLELGDFEDADFSASEALRRDPGNLEALDLLGQVYVGEGRHADAERLFTRGAAMEPEDPYWQRRVACTIRDQGRVHEAVLLAHDLVVRFPDDQDARILYASTLLQEAELFCTREGNLIYLTSKQQVSAVEERLEVVRGIRCTDAEVAAWTVELQRLATKARRWRLYRLTYRRMLVGAILFLLALANSNPMAWIAAIGVAVWVFFTAFKPGYKVDALLMLQEQRRRQDSV